MYACCMLSGGAGSKPPDSCRQPAGRPPLALAPVPCLQTAGSQHTLTSPYSPSPYAPWQQGQIDEVEDGDLHIPAKVRGVRGGREWLQVLLCAALLMKITSTRRWLGKCCASSTSSWTTPPLRQ